MSALNRRSHIYHITVNGTQALGFDTGLDARAFAQARAAHYLSQPGFRVNSAGNIVQWKACGVIEAHNPFQEEAGAGTMHVWGPDFTGIPLDILINDSARRNEAFLAVLRWIDALLALPDSAPLLWPCAALIGSESILFPPADLVQRCMQAEGDETRLSGAAQYVHPDRQGVQGAAFTAAAMLYRLFSGTGAFNALNEEILRQDLREGNFLPIHLAAPGLDSSVAVTIQEALLPKGKAHADNRLLLRLIRESLGAANRYSSIESFFHTLSETELNKLLKEKEKFLHRNKIAVNTRRFVMRNTAPISGIAAALLITIFAGLSIAKNHRNAPSTAGMDSITVVTSYYNALSALDHQFMDACTSGAAGKDDINMVTNLFVITRVRQAYEQGQFQFITPGDWLEAGSPVLDIPVFGITDLHITLLSGSDDLDTVSYSAEYTLWLPMAQDENNGPQILKYNDVLTLSPVKGNWRINEIRRSGDYLNY